MRFTKGTRGGSEGEMPCRLRLAASPRAPFVNRASLISGFGMTVKNCAQPKE